MEGLAAVTGSAAGDSDSVSAPAVEDDHPGE